MKSLNEAEILDSIHGKRGILRGRVYDPDSFDKQIAEWMKVQTTEDEKATMAVAIGSCHDVNGRIELLDWPDSNLVSIYWSYRYMIQRGDPIMTHMYSSKHTINL